jgi:hypothetical protein
MCSDEGVEDRIVKHTNAGFVIGQVVACWLVIVVENKLPSTGNYTLWRLCNG